jgi:hypothetical protein
MLPFSSGSNPYPNILSLASIKMTLLSSAQAEDASLGLPMMVTLYMYHVYTAPVLPKLLSHPPTLSFYYNAWGQFSHIPSGQGHVTFYRTEGTDHTKYKLCMLNGLWYNNTSISAHQLTASGKSKQPHTIACQLNAAAHFELFHQCNLHQP